MWIGSAFKHAQRIERLASIDTEKSGKRIGHERATER